MRSPAIMLAGLLTTTVGCVRDVEQSVKLPPEPAVVLPTTTPSPPPTTSTAPTTVQAPSDAHVAPPRRTGP